MTKTQKKTHTPGLALRARSACVFSISRKQIAMIPLRVAALTNDARKLGFSALIFSDVKAPTGNSADYKQAAAEDLGTSAEWAS